MPGRVFRLAITNVSATAWIARLANMLRLDRAGIFNMLLTVSMVVTILLACALSGLRYAATTSIGRDEFNL